MRICCFVSIWLLTVNVGNNPVRTQRHSCWPGLTYCHRLGLLEGFAQLCLDHTRPCRGYAGSQPLPPRVVFRGIRRTHHR